METLSRYFAQIVPECSPSGTSTSLPACGTEQLQQLAVNIFEFLVITSFTIAVVFILWGGFLLLTSGGSSDRISQGKKAITGAVIGLVIVLGSWIIVSTIVLVLTGCEGWEWWKFQEFPC